MTLTDDMLLMPIHPTCHAGDYESQVVHRGRLLTRQQSVHPLPYCRRFDPFSINFLSTNRVSGHYGFVTETAIRVSERLLKGIHLAGLGKPTSSGAGSQQVVATVLWLACKVLYFGRYS